MLTFYPKRAIWWQLCCTWVFFGGVISSNIHLLGSGHFVKKKPPITFPDLRSALLWKVYLTGDRERCTFRMIITSQWIFVTPCSLADRGVITLDRRQMFSGLSHSLLKFPLLAHKYDLSSKGTAGVDIFSSVFLISWYKGNPAVSWQGGEKKG